MNFDDILNDFLKSVSEENPSIKARYERGLLTIDEALLAYVDKARESLIAEREASAIYYFLIAKGFCDEKARDYSKTLQRAYGDLVGVVSALKM